MKIESGKVYVGANYHTIARVRRITEESVWYSIPEYSRDQECLRTVFESWAIREIIQ